MLAKIGLYFNYLISKLLLFFKEKRLFLCGKRLNYLRISLCSLGKVFFGLADE